MTNCSKENCPREATHYPKIHVPAKGWSVTAHNPIALTMGLELCRTHCEDLDPSEMLEGENGLNKIFYIMAKGKCPPDFERAYVTCVSIDSDEGKLLRKQANGA